MLVDHVILDYTKALFYPRVSSPELRRLWKVRVEFKERFRV
jgi:hypothetical protein